MKLTRSDVEAALNALGILSTADKVMPAEVLSAFRACMKAAHPDTSDQTLQEQSDAWDEIATLRAARSMLMEWIAHRPYPDCKLCGGTGYMKGIAFSPKPCPRCL